jgi:FtsH-binding integral membrane protein
MQPEMQMTSQTTELALSSNKVLRNTYMLLGLSMIPTVVGAMIGISMNFAFMAQSPILGFVGMLAVMFGLFWGIGKNRDNGLGVVLLLGLTFFMGLMLGPILQVALHLKNVASLANMFFQIPAMQLTISAIAVLIFSGFILFDVSRIVTGGETNYIMATLAIYLDIYNLFVNLLQLLMALAGERD